MKLLTSKERRIIRVRKKIKELMVIRLTVRKTSKHIYAQVFSIDGSYVLTSASSVERNIKSKILDNKLIGKTEIAAFVGKILADRMKSKGITQAAFDRSGFKFHGRIKALSESVCKNGVKC